MNGGLARFVGAAERGGAVARIHAAGPELRASTLAWFRHNAARLSLESSLPRVLEEYGRA